MLQGQLGVGCVLAEMCKRRKDHGEEAVVEVGNNCGEFK